MAGSMSVSVICVSEDAHCNMVEDNDFDIVIWKQWNGTLVLKLFFYPREEEDQSEDETGGEFTTHVVARNGHLHRKEDV